MHPVRVTTVFTQRNCSHMECGIILRASEHLARLEFSIDTRHTTNSRLIPRPGLHSMGAAFRSGASCPSLDKRWRLPRLGAPRTRRAHAGHTFCAGCIRTAFQTQRRGRLVCPLCRSTPTHPPLRVPLLSEALSAAVVALPCSERERQSDRAAAGAAVQAKVSTSPHDAPLLGCSPPEWKAVPSVVSPWRRER